MIVSKLCRTQRQDCALSSCTLSIIGYIFSAYSQEALQGGTLLHYYLLRLAI